MKKQTAVEWLEKEIRKQLHVDIKHTTVGLKLFEEAKAKELEQMSLCNCKPMDENIKRVIIVDQITGKTYTHENHE
jgi:hypothetical protein